MTPELIENLWEHRAELAKQSRCSQRTVVEGIRELCEHLGVDCPELPPIDGVWVEREFGDRFGPILEPNQVKKDDRISHYDHAVTLIIEKSKGWEQFLIFTRETGQKFYVSLEKTKAHRRSMAYRLWASSYGSPRHSD